MYICLCKGITDQQLQEAQKQSKSLKDLCKTLGLGSDCGSCIQEASQYVNNNAHHQNKNLSQNNSNNTKK